MYSDSDQRASHLAKSLRRCVCNHLSSDAAYDMHRGYNGYRAGMGDTDMNTIVGVVVHEF